MIKNITIVIFLFLYSQYIESAKDNHNKEYDLNGSRQAYHAVIYPGDTITYKCKYVKNIELHFKDENYLTTEYCFSHVNKFGVKGYETKDIEDVYLGLFNISRQDDESTSITTATVTIPPVVPNNINFTCFCFMFDTQKEKYIRKPLNVRLNPKHEDQVIGCNFNKQESMFWSVKNSNGQIVCNVENVTAQSNLALLCPKNYTMHPNDCFEKVYRYKNKEDIFKETIDEQNLELVPATTILGDGNEFIKRAGDNRFRYATVPSNIGLEKKGVFTCMCKNNVYHYRMNILLNETINSINGANRIPKTVTEDVSDSSSVVPDAEPVVNPSPDLDGTSSLDNNSNSRSSRHVDSNSNNIGIQDSDPKDSKGQDSRNPDSDNQSFGNQNSSNAGSNNQGSDNQSSNSQDIRGESSTNGQPNSSNSNVAGPSNTLPHFPEPKPQNLQETEPKNIQPHQPVSNNKSSTNPKPNEEVSSDPKRDITNSTRTPSSTNSTLRESMSLFVICVFLSMMSIH